LTTNEIEDLLMFMNPKAFKIKGKSTFLLMVLIIAVVGGSAVFLMCRGPNAERKGATVKGASHQMQIEGLRFYGMHQGRKVVSITADRFTIQKGRFGFFRTGLTQEAKIENARIDLYATAVAPQKDRRDVPSTRTRERTPADHASDGDVASGKPSEADNPGRTTAEVHPSGAVPSNASPPTRQPASRSTTPQWDFGDLFAGEALASLLPTKAITAIEAAPVTVVLHGDSSDLTRISAAGATVRLRDQDILFTGGVRVSSGAAELTTERLLFVPRTAHLQTDNTFVLKKGPRTIQGSHLTTDLFLRPL
jgi:hypothetical protein